MVQALQSADARGTRPSERNKLRLCVCDDDCPRKARRTRTRCGKTVGGRPDRCLLGCGVGEASDITLCCARHIADAVPRGAAYAGSTYQRRPARWCIAEATAVKRALALSHRSWQQQRGMMPFCRTPVARVAASAGRLSEHGFCACVPECVRWPAVFLACVGRCKQSTARLRTGARPEGGGATTAFMRHLSAWTSLFRLVGTRRRSSTISPSGKKRHHTNIGGTGQRSTR